MIKNTADLLSKAIQIETISYKDKEKNNYNNYREFISFLEDSFPKVNKECEKSIISNYSVVYKWKSDNLEEKPILFLAHYDVVPVGDNSKWSYPPFSGEIVDGYIWGRGALDCKHQLIAIMSTIENLIEEGYKPSRDIYLAFGHDEEIGGENGAKKIAKKFNDEGIVFDYVLDEGGAVSYGMLADAKLPIALIGVAEKGSSHINITIPGMPGHSSTPPEKTAINRMADLIKAVENNPMPKRLTPTVREMLTKLSPFVKDSFALKRIGTLFPIISNKFEKDPKMNALVRTTIAFTMADAGEAPNSLPSNANITANLRILHGDTLKTTMDHIMDVSGIKDADYEIILEEEASEISKTDHPFYKKLENLIQLYFGEVGVVPYLMLGGTDSRHYSICSDGIYRFTPIKLTKEDNMLIHSYNERISFDNIDNMLKFYRIILKGEVKK